MSADVTITIASATDVLTIPSAALLGADGDYRVRTLDAEGNPVVTPVEVGLVTEHDGRDHRAAWPRARPS